MDVTCPELQQIFVSSGITETDVRWANTVLKYGIKCLKEEPYIDKQVLFSVSAMIRILRRVGYWWQAKTLFSWKNWYLKSTPRLSFFTDSSAEESDSPRVPRGTH